MEPAAPVRLVCRHVPVPLNEECMEGNKKMNKTWNLKEMKKLVLFFAVAFAMSFASCGNKAAESTEATDSVAVVEEVAVEVVDTVAADSVAVDSAAVAE